MLAADPGTGRTVARKVVAAWVHDDELERTEVTVDTDGAAGGETATLTGTDWHPVWEPKLEAWVPLGNLRAGSWLQTSSGTWVQATAVRKYHGTVHDLTVEDAHNYHVLAGTAPVLVHNYGQDETDDIVDVYRAPQRGNGPDELASGLVPARHVGGNRKAYIGTEDVAQKWADYAVGTHEDGYIKVHVQACRVREALRSRSSVRRWAWALVGNPSRKGRPLQSPDSAERMADRSMVKDMDIHDLPILRWGVMDPGSVGSVVDVRIVCVHPFGVGVRIASHDVYGHVNAHHVTDGRFTVGEFARHIGETRKALVLAVEPGRQPTLTIRPSKISEV